MQRSCTSAKRLRIIEFSFYRSINEPHPNQGLVSEPHPNRNFSVPRAMQVLTRSDYLWVGQTLRARKVMFLRDYLERSESSTDVPWLLCVYIMIPHGLDMLEAIFDGGLLGDFIFCGALVYSNEIQNRAQVRFSHRIAPGSPGAAPSRPHHPTRSDPSFSTR